MPCDDTLLARFHTFTEEDGLSRTLHAKLEQKPGAAAEPSQGDDRAIVC